MPRSKRDKVISLTKTGKKATKESRAALIDEVRSLADSRDYVWLFSIEHFRNQHLQEIRKAWKPSRILMGRNAVMRIALGATPETEHRPGCNQIAERLEGDVGLLFTSDAPHVVVDWFADFKRDDFLRTGNVASETIVMPAGPIMLHAGDRAPHSLEPSFRKLGVPSRLDRGVPTLDAPYTVCKKGDKLKPDQVNVIKLLGQLLATFQVVPQACLVLATGALIEASDVVIPEGFSAPARPSAPAGSESDVE